MHIFRSALSACVVKDISDIEYYMPLDRDSLSEEGRKIIERNSSRQGGTFLADPLVNVIRNPVNGADDD